MLQYTCRIIESVKCCKISSIFTDRIGNGGRNFDFIFFPGTYRSAFRYAESQRGAVLSDCHCPAGMHPWGRDCRNLHPDRKGQTRARQRGGFRAALCAGDPVARNCSQDDVCRVLYTGGSGGGRGYRACGSFGCVPLQGVPVPCRKGAP